MFVRIVRHWCKPGQVDAGRDFMDKVGQSTAGAPGFLFRYRLETPDDQAQLTTMTVWRDRASFTDFQVGRKPSDHADPANPFERTASEVFDVTGVTGDAGRK
jgi:heme-degrading monooxygenase HmoA